MEDIPRESQSNVEAIIRRAMEIGLYHFDTAHAYGTCEMQLGEVLKEYNRSDYILHIKPEPCIDKGEFKDQVRNTLEQLHVDYVELLTLHGINNRFFAEWLMKDDGGLDWAHELKESGIAGHVGFSTHAPTDVICRIIETDRVDHIFLHWYFADNRNWPAVELAAKHDMGVFLISPNDHGGKLFTPSPKLQEMCKPLTPMAFNSLWCLSRPEVHTLSLGAENPDDFTDHLVTAEDYYDRRQELTEPIGKRLIDEIDSVFGEGWYHNFYVGLPDYEVAPERINIIHILRLWTLAKALDMHEFAHWRYNMLGNASHWFPGNKAANIGSVDLSRALAESPYAREIPGLLAEAHDALDGDPLPRLSQSE